MSATEKIDAPCFTCIFVTYPKRSVLCFFGEIDNFAVHTLQYRTYSKQYSYLTPLLYTFCQFNMIAGVVDPDDPIIAFRCSPNETYRKRHTTDFILTAEGLWLKKLVLAEVDQYNQSTEDQHKIFIFVMILKMKNER